ncbi:MAG: helix-turn-helix domain-containing protein [Treponema sp.]|jgi:hypothetical protein|nr:helix-turn-helix domain-containing protein [Treponema sp.]
MNLTLGIIIDGFSEYKPVIHKISDTKVQIRGFHYYSPEFTETDTGYLYISGGDIDGKIFSQNCPKHIIVLGNIIPKGKPGKLSLLEKIDTLIQIPKSVPVDAIFQKGNALLASYDAWYNSLLMAVINHKPINTFLNIAAQMLPNPIIVFNNNLSVISSAGSISGSAEGTVWEKFNMPGFIMDSFYTPEEIRKISSYISQKSEQPHIIHPKNDPAHFTLAAHIWIDGKLYGGIALVDINEPFTEGQKETLVIITQVLKLYFQNHSIYMRIAEDKANWLDSLLDGVEIPADIISNYLYRFQWKLDDYFCIITFTASADLKIPIISILDIKQINDLFPDALVLVYEGDVVMIIRCTGRQPPHGKKEQQLEEFLKKDIILHCGISMVFNNFLYLRLFYTQSKFAAAQCKPPLSPAICFYEDYQTDHVLRTLSLGADPRCFCHPGILSLWESGIESQRELVHCLYHYFLNGRNISATADAIHVHRNTLIYRLGKAEEIMNVDIKHPSVKQEFLFIISCMIVQHL